MTRINRILCPVDFSDFSRHALDEAIALAHLYGGCVTALHVFPEALPADPFGGLPDFQPFRLTDQHRAQLLRHLSDFAQAEGAETGRIKVALREGVDIHAEILDAAEQMAPDLIVMGTHGRSGFQRMMLGSVAEKVLHKARCPVLTVPRRTPDAVPAGPAAFTRILCAIDFSPCALAALDYAQSLAAQTRARLDLLTVIELIPMYEGTTALPMYYPGLLDDLKQSVGKQLDVLAATAAPGQTTGRLVVAGKPHREIVRVASETTASVVVLGAHSHSAFEHLLFGSTANRVVRQAGCPVLTIRK